MKHFMDIERLKEANGPLSHRNDLNFIRGDYIQISEKIDGSNASIRFNPETKTYDCFSRTKKLDWKNTLDGFWNFIVDWELKHRTHFSERYVVFGEWCRKNKIVYDKDWSGRWIVYDVWDEVDQKWLLQIEVKLLCQLYDLEYVHVLYEGAFISWDHCREYCHKCTYGPTQEGIVVKNQSKLIMPDVRGPIVLKIVNEKFSEVKTCRPVDPLKLEVAELAPQIVTERRVEKMLYKLRDEGVIPETLEASDMGLVAKVLPKSIYEDCVKEEPEIVSKMGAYAGKAISSLAMKLARQIILGS